MYAEAALRPPQYTRVLVLGASLAGVVNNILRIITMAAFDSEADGLANGARIFLALAALCTGACTVLYPLLRRRGLLVEAGPGARLEAGEGEQDPDAEPVEKEGQEGPKPGKEDHAALAVAPGEALQGRAAVLQVIRDTWRLCIALILIYMCVGQSWECRGGEGVSKMGVSSVCGPHQDSEPWVYCQGRASDPIPMKAGMQAPAGLGHPRPLRTGHPWWRTPSPPYTPWARLPTVPGTPPFHSVTLSIFPGVLVEDAHSSRLGGWYPIILVTIYNVGDMLGRILPATFAALVWTGQNIILISSSIRLLFLPAIIFFGGELGVQEGGRVGGQGSQFFLHLESAEHTCISSNESLDLNPST